MRLVLGLLAILAAFAIGNRYLGPYLTRWLHRGVTDPRRPDSEPGQTGPDEFKRDVAQWRAGQNYAARLYRRFYGKYFSKHN